MITALLILWAGLTTVLVVLLIYRGTLNMHEEDQLFLNDAQSQMAKEHDELMAKMNRLQPWVRICGTASAVLIVVIAGLNIYSRVTQ